MMNTSRTKYIRLAALLSAAAVVAPLWSAPALAQAADEEANGNDIIVTAQRREEKLVDVPMTVSVISAETLTSSGVNSVRDLANVTSGFQLGNGGSYPQPAIRGITTTNAGAYENNVAVFVDGLYQTTPQVLNMDLPNVQNIQILKGPQGTLYGRNATGGALLLDTIDPGREWEGNVEATYGRFNDRRARGYVAGPLAEGVGISIAGTFRQTDGYYKRASRTVPGAFDGNFLGLKQESIRAKLKFELSSSFRATLGYNYTRASDPRGVVFTPIENVPNSYSAASQRDTRPRGLGEAAGDVFEIDFKQHEGFAKLEFDTGIGTLRSITGYAQGKNKTFFDFNGNYAPDLYSGSVVRDRTLQQSIDYNITAIDRMNLVIGANYYNIKTDFDKGANSLYLGPTSYSPFTIPVLNTNPLALSDPRYRKSSDTYFFRTKKAWAIFADATFEATDRPQHHAWRSVQQGNAGRCGFQEQLLHSHGGLHTWHRDCCARRAPAAFKPLPIPISSRTAVYLIPLASSARTSNYSKFTPRAAIRLRELRQIPMSTHLIPRASAAESGTGLFRATSLPAGSMRSRNRSMHGKLASRPPAAISTSKRQPSSTITRTCRSVNTQNLNGVSGRASWPMRLRRGSMASMPVSITSRQTTSPCGAGQPGCVPNMATGFYFAGTGVNLPPPGFNANTDPLKTFVNTGQSSLGVTFPHGRDPGPSGLQMARAPSFTGFLGFDYNIPDGDGGLRFAANVKYTTSYVVTNPSVWGGELASSTRARICRCQIRPTTAPARSMTEVAAGAPYGPRQRAARAPGRICLAQCLGHLDGPDGSLLCAPVGQ